jgi:monofunctional biosynthetic peptidoglycan transglycosylase
MNVKRVFLALLAIPFGYGLYVLWGLPSRAEVTDLATKNPGKTSVMRQREEEAQRAGRPPRHVQRWVPLSRVSRHLVHAVVASEDQKFFGHEGVDWEAIRESAEFNRKKGRLARGGSTITQQLVKNLFFTTQRSFTRKIREVMVAYWLEGELTKKRILELYLNVIEWGDGIYGCEAAALRYYGRSASSLDEDEAAGLAAMIPNPRRINPLVNRRLHERAQRRVLWLMSYVGYLKRGFGAEPPEKIPEPLEEGEGEEHPPEEPEPEPPLTEPSPPLTEPTPPATSPGVG